MYNKDLEPEYNEIIEISKIILTEELEINLENLLLARLRMPGFGVVMIDNKNQLISGEEGILLALERGQTTIKVLRREPMTLRPISLRPIV
jgi:hypothetical protein